MTVYQGQERREGAVIISAETLAEVLRSELAAFSIPSEQHKHHHDLWQAELEERARIRERRERVKTSVIGWFIITVLGGIGTAIYQTFDFIKAHWK